ncbi:uncharacterized protein FTOL_04508 [Fusarium torulosum]|uniref:Uncharacterized protein n=1 Tax=Fusarium torulosum TaxID=33205 RepID=A0AAE8SGS1_9HYPO|nr:uncharacterized protein FTOL_04508 [Fusarium torulosum]
MAPRISHHENGIFRAHELGFWTREILEHLQQDPDGDMALQFLHNIRSEDKYTYNDIEDCVAQVVSVVREAVTLPENQTVTPGLAKIRPKTCGVPNDADQHQDKPRMFLDQLHGLIESQSESLSVFFIQRSIYHPFFGKDVSVDIENPMTKTWHMRQTCPSGLKCKPQMRILQLENEVRQQKQEIPSTQARYDSLLAENQTLQDANQELQKKTSLLEDIRSLSEEQKRIKRFHDIREREMVAWTVRFPW